MGLAGEKGAVTPDTWRTPRHTWRTPRRPTVILAAAGLVVVALIVVVVATRSTGGTGPPGAVPAPGTRAVSVTTGPAGTVDLEGVPGQLIITTATTGQIRLTGQLHWSGRAPLASVRTSSASPGPEHPGPAGRTLHLDYMCAAGSPCTEDYRLSVPASTAVVLSQPSGHVTLSGLAAPVRITAASVDVSASGLRSPSLTASLTSGHLSAVFARAPRLVSLALTSAQATVRLPGVSPGYQVSQQVASGYVHVGVGQAISSPYRVQAQVTSGELELLPAG
jgi:hypothetical protein